MPTDGGEAANVAAIVAMFADVLALTAVLGCDSVNVIYLSFTFVRALAFLQVV